MAEMKLISLRESADIAIRKCATGFHVVGGAFGGEGERAFSTSEGLIEWLSRELGAGPIVWGLTLEVWAKWADVIEKDLVPVPDPAVDFKGYREAIEGNAAFLLRKFVDSRLKEAVPKPPPEPKPKKEKKGKEEKPREPELDSKGKWRATGREEEEKPKEEVKEE